MLHVSHVSPTVIDDGSDSFSPVDVDSQSLLLEHKNETVDSQTHPHVKSIVKSDNDLPLSVPALTVALTHQSLY